MAASDNGFLLLDAGLNLIASNAPALQILCFPSGPDRIKQPKVFLADRVRTSLLDHRNQDSPNFVSEFRSGKRRYICKSFQLDGNGQHPVQPAFAVLLERNAVSSNSALAEIADQVRLTQRERKPWSFSCKVLPAKKSPLA